MGRKRLSPEEKLVKAIARLQKRLDAIRTVETVSTPEAKA